MDREEFVLRTNGVKERLYRTAYLYLGNEMDALEAVDESVYQALRALKQLKQPEFFESWLTRILIHVCHKELRHRKRVVTCETFPDTAGPDEYDPFSLRDAVRHLPEELRVIVVLRFFSGYTQAETAEILRIPQGTVATRQRKALKILRLELGEEERL